MVIRINPFNPCNPLFKMGYEHKCNSRHSALPYQRERMSKSKTTCFTIVQMLLMIGKDAIFDNKTTCFTLV